MSNLDEVVIERFGENWLVDDIIIIYWDYLRGYCYL